MKRNISDILDVYQDDRVSMENDTPYSSCRIRQLTMGKILVKEKTPANKWRTGYIRKLLIAAAIITVLAVPVLAASVFYFADWSGDVKNDILDYNHNPQVGSQEKTWIVEVTKETEFAGETEPCNWMVTLSVEDVTPTGLTYLCTELGAGEKKGTFAATDGYWLERWDENAYVPMDTVAGQNELPIRPGETYRWNIQWEDVYGALETGSYRIGKTYIYTAENGKEEKMDFYAKFRILSQEVNPWLEKYNAAFERLTQQKNLHILLTYHISNGLYAYRTEEIWQSGNDYLVEYTFYNSDDTIFAHSGHMFRDGMGYGLKWAGDDVDSGVSQWNNLAFLDSEYHKSWSIIFEVNAASIGQVCAEGNSISFFSYCDWIDASAKTEEQIALLDAMDPYWNHDYTEAIQTFDEDGNLIRVLERKLLSPDDPSDSCITQTLEVMDTPAEKIREVIAGVDLNCAGSFSWEEDCNEFGDTAIRSGFRNTTPAAINSAQDAIRLAGEEAIPTENPKYRESDEYNVAEAFYDQDAQIWKVHFYLNQDKQFAVIVYLSVSGVTQMLVYP